MASTVRKQRVFFVSMHILSLLRHLLGRVFPTDVAVLRHNSVQSVLSAADDGREPGCRSGVDWSGHGGWRSLEMRCHDRTAEGIGIYFDIQRHPHWYNSGYYVEVKDDSEKKKDIR